MIYSRSGQCLIPPQECPQSRVVGPPATRPHGSTRERHLAGLLGAETGVGGGGSGRVLPSQSCAGGGDGRGHAETGHPREPDLLLSRSPQAANRMRLISGLRARCTPTPRTSLPTYSPGSTSQWGTHPCQMSSSHWLLTWRREGFGGDKTRS